MKHLGLKKSGTRRCLRFEWNTFEVAFLNVTTPVVKSEWNLVNAGNADFMVGKFKYRAAPEGAITRSQPDIREMEERRFCKETRQGMSMQFAVSEH